MNVFSFIAGVVLGVVLSMMFAGLLYITMTEGLDRKLSFLREMMERIKHEEEK